MATALVFSVIALAPLLSESERKIALAPDPALVEALDDYILLLGHPEWNLLERSDVTKRFAQSLWTSLEGLKARTNALTEVLGPAEFSERMDRRVLGKTAECHTSAEFVAFLTDIVMNQRPHRLLSGRICALHHRR